MILAVLEKRCGLRMSDKDVYVNVAGGLKVVEPAVDLAVAVALASSFRDRPVDPETMITGEVGLSGEVRSVHQTDRRLREAQRLGFRRALLPVGSAQETAPKGLELIEARGVREAIDRALLGRAPADTDDDLFAETFDEDEA
jgi:DNA repair protein RadA/Sms